eukprot:7571814-Lingulodinium_polyedra.AAC.1
MHNKNADMTMRDAPAEGPRLHRICPPRLCPPCRSNICFVPVRTASEVKFAVGALSRKSWAQASSIP